MSSPRWPKTISTVVDVPNGASKVVKISVLNSTQHDIYLPARTVMGTITLVSEVLPLTPCGGAGEENNQKESMVHVNQLTQVDNRSQLPVDKTVRWHPPVDLEHLPKQQQERVLQMLYDESDVFVHDDGDIGCIPNLKLKINLKDDTPVQKCYNSNSSLGDFTWFYILDQGNAYQDFGHGVKAHVSI